MAEQLLQPAQIPLLENLAANSTSEKERTCARILLLYHAGKETREISERVGLSPRSVRHWRNEFQKRGMGIFTPIEYQRSADIVHEHEPQADMQPGSETTPKKPAAQVIQYPRLKKNPGLKAHDSMAEAGRKILYFHFAQMISHEQGTRLGQDIEELHDMRVATRRMRAAFEIFGAFFKPKAVKNHLKGLRATGRALGRVRDLDVFMEKAQHYLQTLPEAERSGLDPLLNAWQQDRAIERDKMLAYLDSDTYEKFKQDFHVFVSTPGLDVPAASEASIKPDAVQHVAPVLVYTCLAAVRAYEATVMNAAIEQLHALRIEFKKMRYTMEFFREVLGEQSRDVINDIKLLQDHLGDLNDANVACQILREFIESWEERQINLPLPERQNPEPVVAYLAAKHAERHHLIVTFPEVWEHFNRPELRQNVALAVSVL